MAQLTSYRHKRNPEHSGEPAGKTTDSRPGHRYVLHKHDASQLHYDLRLEQDGVLRSWAIPKGPSLTVGDKRLAVEVEDHPLEYGDFEGVIPEDNYGGGTVMVWDRGEWLPAGHNKKDEFNFILHGEKLTGAWTLVRMANRGNQHDDGKNNWLLIKRHDGDGNAHSEDALAALGDQSALTGRSMDEITDQKAEAVPNNNHVLVNPGTLDDTRKQKLPDTVQPQLATLVRSAPEGDNWLHEFKFDGYRLLARLHNGHARLMTRNDKDWTDRFPQLADALEQLPVDDALLDGEAVAFNADGVSDFQRLQHALSAGDTDQIVYQAFDLLYLDGYSLTAAPLIQRKAALGQLLNDDNEDSGNPIRYTDHLNGNGRFLYRQACEWGLEGAVCKRADSPYKAGRNKNWLKVKCIHDDEYVVGGFTNPGGSRPGFGALLLGAYDDNGHLIYRSRVGTGFTQCQLSELHKRFKQCERKTSPFKHAPPDGHDAHWVRPTTVVGVKYTQLTREGRLRHPSFRGLRADKNAKEVRLTHEYASNRTKSNHKQRRRRGQTVSGVRLTHPDRVLFPKMGVTKLELAQHFEAIEDWIVPALADRPLSLVRCPEGQTEACFFQKHPAEAIPDSIPRVTIAEKNGRHDYVYVRSIADVVGLIQAGTLEFHVWGCRVDDLEHPDTLVFDLDPGPGAGWPETVRTAHDLRARLSDVGLTSFARITGGKGVHLVIPLTRSADWEHAKAFSHALAQQHARTDPDHLTTNMAKNKRNGRIFIDYLRNARGATAIASYSTRARKGAPVAVPVRWDELDTQLLPDHYSIHNLRRRLSALSDKPWAGFSAAKRPITKKMLRAVGVDR